MSEEEILKILNSYTTDLFHSYKEDVILKAIRNLLDLYTKEQEKNKFINEVKAIGTDDVVNVVLTKSQYEYLLEKATNGFNKEQEKNKNSISKNKIKEIIKKVDDCSTDMAETVVFWLEELLKE